MALIKCSECGNEISDKAPACPKCGCPVTKPTEKQELESNKLICPSCNSADVKKVSLMYELGTQNTSSTTVGVGGGKIIGGDAGIGGAVASTSGKVTTLLAQRLAPPTKPSYAGIGCLTLIFASFIFAALCSGGTSVGITLLIFGLVGLTGCIFAWVKEYSKKSEEYKESLDKWNHSWACNRCGNVFTKDYLEVGFGGHPG